MKLIHQLNHRHVKKHSIITVLGITLGLLLYSYLVRSSLGMHTGFNRVEAIGSAATGVLVAYLMYGSSLILDRYLAWNKHLTLRFSTGLCVHFIVAFGAFVLLYFMYHGWGTEVDSNQLASVQIKLAILLFLVVFMYTIVYFALYSYYTYSSLQIKHVIYERRQIELQLKALKSQLSSHFLFNNLNTISALVFKEPIAAESYIRGLAKIYIYSLNSYQTKLVPIAKELELLRSYLALLKTRHGHYFEYDIQVDEEVLEAKIPPLTLQMLVENAVKHNIMNADHLLRIDIRSDGQALLVSNNLTKSPQHVQSFHIGLKTIESRYQLLRNRGISIRRTPDFCVQIPLLR